jgi:hypothetical protein
MRQPSLFGDSFLDFSTWEPPFTAKSISPRVVTNSHVCPFLRPSRRNVFGDAFSHRLVRNFTSRFCCTHLQIPFVLIPTHPLSRKTISAMFSLRKGDGQCSTIQYLPPSKPPPPPPATATHYKHQLRLPSQFQFTLVDGSIDPLAHGR